MNKSIAEQIINTQKKALRQAHNSRFEYNGYEYRLAYDGGIAEFISVFGRPIGARDFKYITGFAAYKMHNKEQVLAMAKNLITQKVNG